MASVRPSLICFSAFLLSCFLPTPAWCGDLHTDATALLAFKAYLASRNSSALASWTASAIAGVCSNWTGISCANATDPSSAASPPPLRVVALQLPSASLSGQIPPSTLASLDALQNLTLSSNQFFGELPSDLANCSSLRSLLLQNNAFSGPLPASALSRWSLLEELDLSFNNFNGSIPPSISDASSLQSVNLQNNSLSGPIPKVTLPNLQSFNVANNELSGSIPSSLSTFSVLSFDGNPGLCGAPLNEACSQSSKLSEGAIAGIVIGVAMGGSLLGIIFMCVGKRAPEPKTSSARVTPRTIAEAEVAIIEEGSGRNRQAPSRRPNERKLVAGEPRLVLADSNDLDAFNIDGLLHASAEVLGIGSLGTAYKAMLETLEKKQLVVVVKRLNFNYIAEYGSHLQALAGRRHENLVPVKAWYFFEDEKLVIYDYLDTCHSLQTLLHCGDTKLEWQTRLLVALAVARAITFMHKNNLVHGNIKSSNILVTAEGQVALTEYGLVQLATNLPRKTAAGIHGYTAPEVLDLSRPTPESDTYSYGLLLLELLTGKNPLPMDSAGGQRKQGEHVDLARWVQSVLSNQWTAEVLDLEIVRYQYIQEEMIQLLQLALLCISHSPEQRPSMGNLLTEIESLTETNGDDEDSANP